MLGGKRQHDHAHNDKGDPNRCRAPAQRPARRRSGGDPRRWAWLRAPAGELRDFSTRMMAVTIRAAIDAARYQLATDPHVDLHDCGRELANLFDRASTRSESTPTANPKETL